MSRWIENDAQWYEQRMVHCAACGRLIAKHFLIADVAGERTTFCGEGCEQIYRDYVLTERGRDYQRPADVMEQYRELMVP
ncbi:MAG: hypothetical protein QOF33_2542 [Thermomicrobiales bacterium]|jgi:hypothetical protein|nr:hypothetical protein [Thermomicrobiales bacterium]MEA2530819.1 hypothetical protein [Thermomicrobiales bacterium]MEA2584457.1 hypothetical protein [Thermomicrobiales bacterium]MEA2593738.1 hypothetical protein [Thermomicrobiales bacterium]